MSTTKTAIWVINIILMLSGAQVTVAQTTTSTAATAKTATASETAAPTSTSTAAVQTTAPEIEPPTSNELRSQFNTLLRRMPPEVATILALDPSLLGDDAFLGRYPELGRFVTAHGEVRRNPHFYLEEFEPRPQSGPNNIIEPMMAFAGFALFAYALTWLVRTIIEQKRWSRLARRQTEVHNKILDRFGTTSELLEYINTPAGRKFLESAPIPVYTETPTQNAPTSRVIWSVQAGLVVAAAGIGMLSISGKFGPEGGPGLFAIGVIALCVGIGFIASAAVSIFLSKRLMAWLPQNGGEPRLDDGLVK